MLGGAPVIAETLLGECARQNRTTSLRTIVLGGAMIPRPLLQMAIDRFSIRPVRAYGSSEAPIHTASRSEDPLSECIANDGAPLPGAEMAIGSANDASELRVRGPNLFQGYLDRSDNERAFSAGWFCTGDTADIEAGHLVIRGRLNELVVRKGMKISLQEIDDAVSGLRGRSNARPTEWPTEKPGSDSSSPCEPPRPTVSPTSPCHSSSSTVGWRVGSSPSRS